MGTGPDTIELLGFRVTYLHADARGQLSLLLWEAPVGARGIPLHFHTHTEEGFYVLRGELGLWLDDEELVRATGSYTAVHAGQRHSFWNAGSEPAAYLTPIAPAGFANYFGELAEGLASAPSDDEAAALRQRLSETYDIVVVGPPPELGAR